ncbi:MAG: CAP domain-containing protein [Nodosilinea sp.]
MIEQAFTLARNGLWVVLLGTLVVGPAPLVHAESLNAQHRGSRRLVPKRLSSQVPEPPPQLARASTSTTVLQELLVSVNVERQQAGANPVGLNPQLSDVAQHHAEDLANNTTLSHDGSDGSTMQSRIEAANYRWSVIGENVAVGQPTANDVMISWMSSPGHRQNILNPDFTELGVGYAEVGGQRYWVQVFARPRG